MSDGPRFYLLSVKWSMGRECLTWWGPDRSGYSMMLENAGTYSEEEAAELNDGVNTLAIPVEAADALARRCVHGNEWHVIVAARMPRKGTP